MTNLAWLITGGFAKGYRTQILGLTAALSAIGLWAVGDLTLPELLTEIPVILGGLGLAALGAKVDDAAAKGGRDAGVREPDRSA
ncbi:hypothetical protein [Methyloceanibacter sp.]|uniref:hypothetical protein n=1 Tax=Methyloceanibacter sp. TaxID=1965321 RepID=UPI002CC6CA20|nr:hypothetical protein [Methyloceanibacter sp.]HML91763.1 hypothetical protein [Methyloceanibacter sp.]